MGAGRCARPTCRSRQSESVVPLPEDDISDPSCDLLNAPHIGVPTHEVNEMIDDERMFTHSLGCVLLGQGAYKVAGVLLQFCAWRGFLVLTLPQRLKIGLDLVAGIAILP